MKRIINRYQPGWPAVVLGCVVALCITALLIFAPENVRDRALEALGWIAYIASQAIGPIVQRKLRSLQKSETDTKESKPDA